MDETKVVLLVALLDANLVASMVDSMELWREIQMVVAKVEC